LEGSGAAFHKQSLHLHCRDQTVYNTATHSQVRRQNCPKSINTCRHRFCSASPLFFHDKPGHTNKFFGYMLSGIFFTLGALGRESASAWIVSMNASVCLKKQKYGKITVLGLSCYQENTHTCFPSFSWVLQPFYNSLDFVWDKLGEPVPEDTFTNSHLSWSSIIPICFLHLLRSTASSLLNSRA